MKILKIVDNDLSQIPESIGNLSQLTELNLSGNRRITEVPEFISNLRNLKELDINFTSIDRLPDFLKDRADLNISW